MFIIFFYIWKFTAFSGCIFNLLIFNIRNNFAIFALKKMEITDKINISKTNN